MKFRAASAICAAFLAVAALAACEGAVMTHYLNQQPLTARAYWTAAGSGKTLFLQVHNPPDAVSPEALAAVFPSPVNVGQGRFTADYTKADFPQYRFVLAFDTPVGFSGSQACTLAPHHQAPRDPDGGSLMAAFCYGTEMQTQVRAHGAAKVLSRGLERPPARRLLFQLAYLLVPPHARDPDLDDRRMP